MEMLLELKHFPLCLICLCQRERGLAGDAYEDGWQRRSMLLCVGIVAEPCWVLVFDFQLARRIEMIEFALEK